MAKELNNIALCYHGMTSNVDKHKSAKSATEP
jgi:hypothetical protein